MASTLRTAIRTIAQTPDALKGAGGASSAKKLPERETVDRTIAALTVIWNALQAAWPKFEAWFRKGLTDDEWHRLSELANKLPALSTPEREELLGLVKLGLRLNRQSPSETEAELPDSELDGPVTAG